MPAKRRTKGRGKAVEEPPRADEEDARRWQTREIDFKTFIELLRQNRNVTKGQGNIDESRWLLKQELPKVIQSINKQLRGKSIEPKVWAFSALKELLEILPDCLTNHFGSLVPGIEIAVNDKSSSSDLKIEALGFTRLAMASHSPSVFYPYIKELSASILSAIGDRDDQVIAEALRVCGELLRALRPDFKTSSVNFRPYIGPIYKAVLRCLANQDQDQSHEVKECAICCLSLVVSTFGDVLQRELPHCLPILVDRMGNEITRLTAVKEFSVIVNSPLRIDLSCVLDFVVSELTAFLREANTALRQATLRTLNSLVVPYGGQIDYTSYETIIAELSTLISDTDLHTTALALELCCTIMVVKKSIKNVGLAVGNMVLPQTLVLVRSALLQGQALQVLQRFFASAVEFANTSFDDLLDSFISAAKPSQSGNLGKEALSSIATCVAVLCLEAGDQKYESTIEKLKGILKDDSTTNCTGQHMALLCLGEIGRRKDLSNHVQIENIVIESFQSRFEEIKSAASYALGNIAAGNLSKYLPFILDQIDNQQNKQFVLLHSLKEVIVRQSVDHTGQQSGLQDSNIEKILALLFNYCESEEEGIRNVVAECLGKIALIEPKTTVKAQQQQQQCTPPPPPRSRRVNPPSRTKVKDLKRKGKAVEEPPPAAEEEAKQCQAPEAGEDYPLFILDRSNLARSYREVMDSVLNELVKCLIAESSLEINGKKVLRKLNGKLYTPKRGGFLIQIRDGMDSPPTDWVTLQYRWSDLYFESFNSRGTWFRTKGAKMPIPPKSQIPYSCVQTLNFNASYDSIGGYDIRIGPIAFKNMHGNLLNARTLILQGKEDELKSGSLSLPAVGVSEALRFPYLEMWIEETLLGAERFPSVLEEKVPKRFQVYFRRWRKESDDIARSDPINQQQQDYERIRVLKYNHRLSQNLDSSPPADEEPKGWAAKLIERIWETEERVKMQINTFIEVLRQIHNVTKGQGNIDKSSPLWLLKQEVPKVIKCINTELFGQSIKTKVVAFTALKELVIVLPDCLADHFGSLVPGIEMALNDKSSKSELKIEALVFTRHVMASHSPSVFYPYIGPIYNAVLKCLANQDQDQSKEVKECAICCMSLMVSTFGDGRQIELPKCLSILVDMMVNDITRLTAVKAFSAIANSPLRIDLSCVLDRVVSELTAFLREDNTALRQATLETLNSVVTYGGQIGSSSYETIIVELSTLISDMDLRTAALALELCCTIMVDRKSIKNVGLAVRNKVLPQALGLVRSALLQGQALLNLQRFFATLVQSANTSFDALLDPLISAAKPSQSGCLAKQAPSSIAKCVSVLCLEASDHKCASTIEKLKGILKDDSATNCAKQHMALLCLGEIGRRKDLSNHVQIENIVIESFQSRFEEIKSAASYALGNIASFEEIKSAASYALGNIAIGNLSKYLPFILDQIDNQQKKKYLLVHSLKEVILRQSVDHTGQSGLQDSNFLALFKRCESEEEGIQNVVAECLGKIALIEPQKSIPALKVCTSSPAANTRAIVAIAIKHSIVEQPEKIDKILYSEISTFLMLIKDSDRHVRRAAVLALSTAARNKPNLIKNLLQELLPLLYDQTVIKQELIRTYDLSPFKHVVDDGLELRKAAFECVDTLLDIADTLLKSCIDQVNPSSFVLPFLLSGLGDHYDVKMTCHLILSKLAFKCPSAVLAVLDSIVEPIEKTISHKPKGNAVKQEVDRNEDMIRSALRAISSLSRISGSDYSIRFKNLMNKITTTPALAEKYNLVRSE